MDIWLSIDSPFSSEQVTRVITSNIKVCIDLVYNIIT